MFTSVAFYFSSDDEDESEADNDDAYYIKMVKKTIRQRANPFDFSDAEFIEKYRMSKTAFRYIFSEINFKIKSCRSTAIPMLLKLATTLRVLAEDDYQHNAGNDLNLGFAQPTVSKFFSDVIDLIETEICPKWITFNMSDDEKVDIKLNFFEKCGIPGIVGCIDGMHVKIIKPKRSHEQHLYENKYGSHSLNAMIVCDHKMLIRFVDARNYGSRSDAFTWEKSELRQELKKKYLAGETNTWLLGDPEYPLEPFLMTPFEIASENSMESYFNSAHQKGRRIIRKTLLVLKNRFRCLLGKRILHYEPPKVTKIVNACAALHNIAMHFDGEAYFVEGAEFLAEEDEEEQTVIEDQSENTDKGKSNEAAVEIRNQVMEAMAYLKSEPE